MDSDSFDKESLVQFEKSDPLMMTVGFEKESNIEYIYQGQWFDDIKQGEGKTVWVNPPQNMKIKSY